MSKEISKKLKFKKIRDEFDSNLRFLKTLWAKLSKTRNYAYPTYASRSKKVHEIQLDSFRVKFTLDYLLFKHNSDRTWPWDRTIFSFYIDQININFEKFYSEPHPMSSLWKILKFRKLNFGLLSNKFIEKPWLVDFDPISMQIITSYIIKRHQNFWSFRLVYFSVTQRQSVVLNVYHKIFLDTINSIYL